jgi:hypothetical protein
MQNKEAGTFGANAKFLPRRRNDAEESHILSLLFFA